MDDITTCRPPSKIILPFFVAVISFTFDNPTSMIVVFFTFIKQNKFLVTWCKTPVSIIQEMTFLA